MIKRKYFGTKFFIDNIAQEQAEKQIYFMLCVDTYEDEPTEDGTIFCRRIKCNKHKHH